MNTSMEFSIFQEGKTILIRHGSNSAFEDEEGNLLPAELDYFAHDGYEYQISPDCNWLILYGEGLYIERLKDCQFLMTIENHQYLDVNLTALEHVLYKWSYEDDIEKNL